VSVSGGSGEVSKDVADVVLALEYQLQDPGESGPEDASVVIGGAAVSPQH